MTTKKVATTVKVDDNLYDQFKIFGIRYKLTLQGLVERTIFRYVTEETFRDDMNNYRIPVIMETSSSVI